MPLITISQDYGSHGYYAAQKIAQKLQLELYDDETLREAAGKLRVPVLQLFYNGRRTGQFICFKTGEIYLLLTGRHYCGSFIWLKSSLGLLSLSASSPTKVPALTSI